MWNKLTFGGRLVITILIMGAVVCAYIFLIKPNIKTLSKGTKGTTATSQKKSSGGLFSSGDELTVTYNTFIGVAGLIHMNDGIAPNKESRMYKEYGILLTINIQDIVKDSRSSLISGDIDAVYCTTDALSIDMSSGSGVVMAKAKQIMQINQSRGADVLVVDPSIKRISDLKGKEIACAVGTASQTGLIEFLKLSKMTVKDVIIIKVGDGIEASNMFKSGQVPAAMVWYPDNKDCLDAIPGSRELISTKQASNIIADGLLVTEEVLNEKGEEITKLVTAWLVGNAEMNVDEAAKQHAAKVFARDFLGDKPGTYEVSLDMLSGVRFSTYGDNMNFFGLNPTFTGVTGDEMYTKMSVIYANLGQTKSPQPWRSISDVSILQAINLSSDPKQAAEVAPSFAPAPKELETAPAISNIKASINFDNNSAELDEDDKYIIKKEFAGIAKSFRDARIRIAGNTDNVGNAAYNKTLSRKRAQAVADYLIQEYSFDPDKFIIIGNGSKEAIEDGSVGSNENYRRTDFEVVN
ncbi:MAG: phosphate ABC transporter substrate-binding/OmpA family protein [Dehalococcoidia bacterium]|jgi:NitT/TauT family transport system substrate-binding protein